MVEIETKRFYAALRDTNLAVIEALVREYVEKQVSPVSILNDGLIGAMGVLGQEFKACQVWVPEVLLAARNMHRAIEILKPELIKYRVSAKGRLVIGTVKGDIHDIGKNLVTMMMTGAGYEVTDLGTDVPAGRFLDMISKVRPEIVGLSALLTTTMLEMRETIQAIRKAFPKPPWVMIGGAPVTQRFADEIAADGYGQDAVTAVEVADRLLSLGGRV
jgi:methanogenic corrinoid protein MtbC1